MSQSCFSLGFLSQNSLWKLSTFHGYKGIYSTIREECEKSFFYKTGYFGDSVSWVGWVASLSHKLTARPDCNIFPVVLQLSWPFSFWRASHMWHFGKSPVVSHSRDLVERNLLNAHTLEFFTLSHTQPLHNSYLNTRYLIAEIQANLARNKANTWLNKFNLIAFIIAILILRHLILYVMEICKLCAQRNN